MAAFQGLRIGVKSVTNAASDTVFSFVTLGGLLTDAENPAKIEVTDFDRDFGYDASNVAARIGTEILAGVATGGAAAALGKGGMAAKAAGYGIGAMDAGGNAFMAGSGVADAVENGVSAQNAAQILGGGLGVAGNFAGALGKSVDDLADASKGAGKGAGDAVEGAVPTRVGVDDVYNPHTGQLKVLQDACFAPETLIATPHGPRAIGEIRKGDKVLAFDHRTGTWVEREVAKFHESIYEGPLLTVTTDSGPIRTTVYHPFWVLSGRDLDERSTPRELAENEDQGFTLPGRWVNSHELRCGDVLIGHDGQQRFVRKIEQEFVSGFLVHNLTIDEDHTFAVGADAVLVHNTADCNLNRPYKRKDFLEAVDEAALKTEDGRFIDPNTKEVIDGPHHYGHRYGHEHRRKVKEAAERGMDQKEFNDWINSHPEWFQIEDPASNFSHRFEKPGG